MGETRQQMAERHRREREALAAQHQREREELARDGGTYVDAWAVRDPRWAPVHAARPVPARRGW